MGGGGGGLKWEGLEWGAWDCKERSKPRSNYPAFNEVEARHEILKYKSSIITDTGNRDRLTCLNRHMIVKGPTIRKRIGGGASTKKNMTCFL